MSYVPRLLYVTLYKAEESMLIELEQVIGASQKGISVPPGVSITAFSQRSLEIVNSRKTPIPNYYANLKRWQPVMESYEKGTPAYFATPPVVRAFLSKQPARRSLLTAHCFLEQNLLYALEASLNNIISGPVSLEDRFKLHREAAKKFRQEATQLGFKTVALSEDVAANGMTAVYVPEGVEPPKLIGALAERGIIIAGGLHKDIKTKYIRFGTYKPRQELLAKPLSETNFGSNGAITGHMGVSVVERPSDAEKILSALKASLEAVKSK
jgi:alanine-glyoxylate transaminase/serine-glyoxylate transaminase/serine-pyruvate transaminase